MADDAADGADALEVPHIVNWPIFPFEGDLRVRALEPVSETERARAGDPGGPPCYCEDPENHPQPAVWSNGTWVVRSIRFGDRAAPFPAYMLETADHLDFGDMSDALAQEFGLLSLRLERAMMSLGSVGRVHINRWGDGGSHFHVWFLGRPRGAWQFSGYVLPLWGFILPPLDPDLASANDRHVAAELDRTVPSS